MKNEGTFRLYIGEKLTCSNCQKTLRGEGRTQPLGDTVYVEITDFNVVLFRCESCKVTSRVVDDNDE